MSRPALIVLLTLALARAGAAAPQSVEVSVRHPGSSPEEVETLVTVPLETQLMGLEGVAHVWSASSEGLSRVLLELRPGAQLMAARQKAAERVGRAAGALPEGVEAPLLAPTRQGLVPPCWITLSGAEASEAALGNAAEELALHLARVPGVREIQPVGIRRELLTVRLDGARLIQYALTAQDVVRALEEATKPRDAAALGEVVVLERRRAVVRLKDVAAVARELRTPERPAWARGKPAVAVGVQGPAEDVAKALKEWKHDGTRAELALDLARQPGWIVEVGLAPGVSREGTGKVLGEMAARLEKIEGVRRVLALLPGEPTHAENVAVLLVAADVEKADDIRRALREVPGVRVRLLRPGSSRPPLMITIQGNDLERLARLSGRLSGQLAGEDKVTDLWATGTEQAPQVRIRLDREKMARLGLRPVDVMTQLELQGVGGAPPEVKLPGGLAVQVRLGEADEKDLKSMVLPTERGRVPLGAVARLETVSGPREVLRLDGRRVAVLTLAPARGATLAGAAAACRAAARRLAEAGLPPGSRLLLWREGAGPEELGRE